MSDTNSDTEDFFAIAERQQNQFLKQIAEAPEGDIFGIVDAGGAAGGRRDNEPWSLILHLAGWKHKTANMQRGELRVEMPVSEEALAQFRADIKPYDIVHLRGRVSTHPSGRIQAVVTDLVSRLHRDSDLEQFATELQKPVIHIDGELGEFVFDRSVNWFSGQALWQGRAVRLDLSVESEQKIEDALETAKKIWKDQDGWAMRIGDFAVAELLESKNANWLDENEAEVSSEEFKGRMQLESVTVHHDGEFAFWHDDGGLFWGHSIQVSGNLHDGLTHIDTPG
jgi:hypothetical protein